VGQRDDNADHDHRKSPTTSAPLPDGRVARVVRRETVRIMIMTIANHH
jgi:hypothetical protein